MWADDGFHPDTWDPPGGFATHKRYGMSKLANLLFTAELARRGIDPVDSWIDPTAFGVLVDREASNEAMTICYEVLGLLTVGDDEAPA